MNNLIQKESFDRGRTEPSRAIRVGVIGCGQIGNLHTQAIAESRHATLAAVCDIDLQRAESIARKYGAHPHRDITQMLEQESLQAVTVATPGDLHMDPVMLSVARGCHVFCEKPLAHSTSDIQTMIAACEQHGVHLGVDFNRRFGFGYRKAYELIAAGRIGRITHAMMRVTDGRPSCDIEREEYGLMHALLTHHVDLLRTICGEIDLIQCTTRLHPDTNVVNDAAAIFRSDNTAIATLIAGWQDGQARTEELMQISGTHGVIEVQDVVRQVTLRLDDPDHVESFQPNFFNHGSAFYDSVYDHVQAFLHSIAEDRSPPVTAADGLRSAELIDAMIQSQKTSNTTSSSQERS